jgi:hypothetical protein
MEPRFLSQLAAAAADRAALFAPERERREVNTLVSHLLASHPQSVSQNRP